MVRWKLLLALLCVNGASQAGVLEPGELQKLPPYCQARMGDNKVLQNHWKGLLTQDGYLHVHHYCFALALDDRALLESQPKQKDFLIQRAISNYDYVLQRWTPAVPLLPEVFLKKGRLLYRIGQKAEGIQLLQRSVEVKPDWPPSRAALSDALRETGKKNEARKVLEDGLRLTPKAKMLKRRLEKL